MRNSVNAGARLDRLPVGAFHRRVMWLVGLGYFFDSFDNTLSASVLASMLNTHWSTLQLNSVFMSATFAGLTIGAALAGLLSDRYGRLFAYQFNLAIFGGLSLLCAFAPTMQWLIVLRFVMGIGMGAEYVMGFGLVTEFVPPTHRGRYMGLLALFGGVGVFVTAVFGMVVIPWLGWRGMFVIGGVGTLWVWWLRRHLPESPRWLERMGRGQEAEIILRRIEEEAGVARLPPASQRPLLPVLRVSIWVLFSRPVIRRTLLAIFVNIICLFGSYTLTGWMPTFFVKQGMSVTHSLAFNSAMMAGFVAGPILCMVFADRIGRRWGLSVLGALCAAIGATYPFLTSAFAIVTCGFLMVTVVSAFLYTASGINPELFPTDYRFRGSGVAQMFGRIGLVASPFFILALFNRYGIGGVVSALSGMYLFAAVLMAIAGVETNQQSLESLDPEMMSGTPDAMPSLAPRR
jgi:MFS transporter, putative metabolite:H+ symporter